MHSESAPIRTGGRALVVRVAVLGASLVALTMLARDATPAHTFVVRALVAHQAGRYGDAVDAYDDALRRVAPSEQRAALEVGRCEAVARVELAAALRDFAAFAGDPDSGVSETHFSRFAGSLIRLRQFSAALDVIETGIVQFPASTQLERVRAEVLARRAGRIKLMGCAL